MMFTAAAQPELLCAESTAAADTWPQAPEEEAHSSLLQHVQELEQAPTASTSRFMSHTETYLYLGTQMFVVSS